MKSFKRIIFFVIIFCLFFLFSKVQASSISRIDMDVYIDSNGNASITEVWSANLNSGTEGYRSYSNLSDSIISNFSVIDDLGNTYELLPNWNPNASFDEKAYKCGINQIYNGIELCWGISNYGNRTYTLKYTVSNLVKQYTDTQGIYFNFLKLNQYISNNATVKIHSDIPFSIENSKIWAFGYDGTINFDNGYIILDSNGSLPSYKYMVGLIRFEDNLFNTNSTSSQSFDEIYDSAFEGINKKSTKNSTTISPIWMIFIILEAMFFLRVIYLLLTPDKYYDSNRYYSDLDFGPNGLILPDEANINYYREVPCNKDLERAFWICYHYKVVSLSSLYQGIIGGILLKWIKNGYITVTKTKGGLFNFKDNNYAIDFSRITNGDTETENELLKILISASGNNKILEAKEFEKWCKKKYSTLNIWLSNLIKNETRYLENQGLLTDGTKKARRFFYGTKTVPVKVVNQELRQEAIQLKGFKKFLLDFSLMPERQYFEVHLWEEYLIFAELLGIADKVEEQFSKLYPDFNQLSSLNTSDTTIAVRNFVQIGYTAYSTSYNKPHSSTHDYSGRTTDSGSGGRSYSSGGRSSGGSSGGGFR